MDLTKLEIGSPLTFTPDASGAYEVECDGWTNGQKAETWRVPIIGWAVTIEAKWHRDENETKQPFGDDVDSMRTQIQPVVIDDDGDQPQTITAYAEARNRVTWKVVRTR